jgi:PAS domain S-box-containing protein
MTNMQGNILECNQAYADMLGYTKKEIKKLTYKQLTPEKWHKMEADIVANKITKTGYSDLYEKEYIRKDGRVFPIDIRVWLIKDKSGNPTGMWAIVRDISERRKTEDALGASEQRYKTYLEVTGQIGWTTPADGVVDDAPEWRKYTGQTKEEVKGWGWLDAIHPDDRERTTEAWNKAVATKAPYEVEYRVRRKDGVYRYFLARGIPSLKEDGSIREWVGTCIDITERKQAEDVLQKAQEELEKKVEERTAALKLSTEQLRMATEGTGIGTWHWSIVSGELLWSDKCKAIFGIPLDETMSYERFLQALHPDDRERTDKAVQDALNNHKEYAIDYRSVWPDGSVHWITARGLSYYDAAGKAVRMEGMVLDITERKAVEEELRRKYEELERFRKATVDREFRMQELQEEIARLKEGKK